ncbi:hypothetical protein J6590_067801, partial [Homalodisca vitripennis]
AVTLISFTLLVLMGHWPVRGSSRTEQSERRCSTRSSLLIRFVTATDKYNSAIKRLFYPISRPLRNEKNLESSECSCLYSALTPQTRMWRMPTVYWCEAQANIRQALT